MADLGSDAIDEEIRASQDQPEEVVEDRGGRGRRRAAITAAKLTKQGEVDDLGDSDSEDADFGEEDNSNSASSGDEDGEEDMEDEISDDEVAAVTDKKVKKKGKPAKK